MAFFCSVSSYELSIPILLHFLMCLGFYDTIIVKLMNLYLVFAAVNRSLPTLFDRHGNFYYVCTRCCFFLTY